MGLHRTVYNAFHFMTRKSHSVDTHGYANPLDDSAPVRDGSGEALPVESHDVTNASSSPAILGQSTEEEKIKSPEGEKPCMSSPEKPSPTEKKTLVRTITQPPNTQEYAVKVSDTLAGIAARFDTTPSELAKINRLTSRLIFPGQTLYVPHKKTGQCSSAAGSPTDAVALQESTLADNNKLVDVSVPSGSKEKEKQPTPVGSPSSDKSKSIEPLDVGKVGSVSPSLSSRDLDKECLERFLKINARYITDGQGIVTGVLLVTPNALMFDPNVSDPLVIEHGAETYGVVAPMDMIFRAAMYTDIARMKVKHAPEVPINAPKADVYYGHKGQLSQSRSEEESAQTTENALPPEDKFQKTDKQKPDDQKEEMMQTSSGDGSSKETGKSVQKSDVDASTETAKSVQESDADASTETAKKEPKDGVQPVLDLQQPKKKVEMSSSLPADLRKNDVQETKEDAVKSAVSSKPTPSGRGSIPEELEGIFTTESLSNDAASEVAPEGEGQIARQGSRRERMMKRLSYPVESLSSYTQSSISKIFSTSPKNLMDFSTGMFVRTTEEDGKGKDASEAEFASTKTEGANGKEQPTSEIPVYRNMVDEKYDILASLDKIIPRPARSCDDPPLYLCLRMGRPVNKKVHLSSPVLSYGKKRLQKEYWFSIPRERADDLYIFFERWTPDVYGDVEEVKLEDRGFEPIETDEEGEGEAEGPREETEESSEVEKAARKGKRRGPFALLHLMGASQFIPMSDINETSPTDWEVVSLRDSSKFSTELDLSELPIPELSETSEILTEEHRRDISKNLPARAEGYSWTLLYSTSKHGFSLKTLYREMLKYETPVVLVILDTEGAVFGALTSGSLRVSEHFYGTGETYLFTFKPNFKCYQWTGENMYFIKGNTNSLVIGAGDGQFGLWLDEDLYHGRSHQCKTFHNETLSSQDDFVVKALEAWGFV